MWGMRQGARAYLTKPFSEEELSEVIAANLGTGAPDEPTAA
jgi:twitching motility two-component system response regulator PilH